MKHVLWFESRRLYHSWMLSGLVMLTMVMTGIFFWFTQVEVNQYRVQLQQELIQQDTRWGQAINTLRSLIKDSDDQAQKKQMQDQLRTVIAADDGIAAQIDALKKRQSPAFLAGGLRAARYGIEANQNAPAYAVGGSTQQLQLQEKQYRALTKARQAFENPDETLQVPGLLVNWQKLLASPATLVLVVLILSTLWVIAVFTPNQQWMQLNVQPGWYWLVANWLLMSGLWAGRLLLANGMMYLLGQLWGQPLLSGRMSWHVVRTGTQVTNIQAWLAALAQGWLFFVGGYGMWLIFTQQVQRWRRW